jgi:drug/metabolite transporter (DMT)-like permease
MASGMLASALGYVLWYTVLPSLRAIHAASVQLSVPVLAAFGGVIFLNEAITLRLAIASAAIFAGISLVIMTRHRWPR